MGKQQWPRAGQRGAGSGPHIGHIDSVAGGRRTQHRDGDLVREAEERGDACWTVSTKHHDGHRD